MSRTEWLNITSINSKSLSVRILSKQNECGEEEKNNTESRMCNVVKKRPQRNEEVIGMAEEGLHTNGDTR